MGKTNQLKLQIFKTTLVFLMCIFAVSNVFSQWDFQTNYLKIHINSTGYITSMKNIFKASQPEFSPSDEPSPLMCLYDSKKNVYYYSSSASFVSSTNTMP